jgi:hypothetical protein
VCCHHWSQLNIRRRGRQLRSGEVGRGRKQEEPPRQRIEKEDRRRRRAVAEQTASRRVEVRDRSTGRGLH